MWAANGAASGRPLNRAIAEPARNAAMPTARAVHAARWCPLKLRLGSGTITASCSTTHASPRRTARRVLLWAQTFFDRWLELAIGNFQRAVAGYCQIDLQPVFALGQMPEREADSSLKCNRVMTRV